MDDFKSYFFFSGYYTVAAAAEILNRHGIENRIVKAPVYAHQSCNFALQIDDEAVEVSKYILEVENIEKITVKKL